MRAQTFHFEIKDLLTQFIAAFDDIIIKRYDKNRVAATDIHVRYVYSPKQRVLFDIVNRAQNITIPVVAVSINSISRDESRVFNKIDGYYYSRGLDATTQQPTSVNYKSPVPINIGISMSMVTKFQSDMDQILSNFIPYNNPYIIISWKVPNDIAPNGFTLPQEIRSEVLWDGQVRISYPTDINASEKYKVIGDTSFVIKGWLFPAQKKDVGNIFYVDSNFYASRNVSLYTDLTGNTFVYPVSTGLINEVETVSVSGFPQPTYQIDYNYTDNEL